MFYFLSKVLLKIRFFNEMGCGGVKKNNYYGSEFVKYLYLFTYPSEF